MPFKEVEIDGKKYFKEVDTKTPSFQFCPVGYVSDTNREDIEEKNLWENWKKSLRE